MLLLCLREAKLVHHDGSWHVPQANRRLSVLSDLELGRLLAIWLNSPQTLQHFNGLWMTLGTVLCQHQFSQMILNQIWALKVASQNVLFSCRHMSHIFTPPHYDCSHNLATSNDKTRHCVFLSSSGVLRTLNCELDQTATSSREMVWHEVSYSWQTQYQFVVVLWTAHWHWHSCLLGSG